MRIKDIFWIVISILFVRVFIISTIIYSSAIKASMVNEVYGFENISIESLLFLDKFILLTFCVFLAVICLILRSIPITNLDYLKNLSFHLFVLMGFLALPDVIDLILGKPFLPIVLFLNVIIPGMLFCAYKRGII
ncbi:MAG: hypothetical protein QNK68_08165 [Flavobacteriales bacterium]